MSDEIVWKCYENYPDLSGAGRIAIDVETYDPELLDKGPGTIRKDGYICGFSVATDDGFKGYYPIRHAEGNLHDPQQAIRWFKDVCQTEHIPKIGANILYDAEWIKADFGFDIMGQKWDVQIADPLLDENYRTYRLDALAERWLGLHKEESGLYKAGVEILGLKGTGTTDEDKKKHIVKQVKGLLWKLPASAVGRYGEEDASLPIKIFALQEKALREKGLWDIFLLESEVLDVLLAMRFQGIPVDLNKAEKVRDELQLDLDDTNRKIKRRVGFEPNIWSGDDIVKCCDILGLPYLRTKKGAPSFEADWLREQDHALFQLILHARQVDRSGGVFVQNKIIDMAVNGRLYPSFWQVKSERNGTVSGRFSSSNPNAQQFPSKNELLAEKVRSLLVAEPGCDWYCFDWKQQEPKLTVHYAYLLGLPGATAARDTYVENPDADYHQMVSEWTGLERKTAKSINLGLSYGMGAKLYSEKYNKTLKEAKDLFNLYHERMPFIKALSRRCEGVVSQRGYIKTLLGRHCNFNLYGPPRWKEGIVPKRKQEALKEFGAPINRYFTYRAMNRLIQGSAADMVKKAMVNCYRAGYVPNITVHDELDFAYLNEEKQVKEIKEIMNDCVRLEVPLSLDIEKGKNWGQMEVYNEPK